jgi:hypothetical protein
VIRDVDRDDREPEPTSDAAPDSACSRDWHPVEAPEHRQEPKHEDEPVRWSSPGASSPDPNPDPEPAPGAGGRDG